MKTSWFPICAALVLFLSACAQAPNKVHIDEYSTIEASMCGPSCAMVIIDSVF